MKKFAFGFVVLLTSIFSCEMVLAERALPQHFGAEDSCYARQYSQEHLTKNPEQIVSFMRFEHSPKGFDMEFDAETGIVVFDLTVRFKGKVDNYVAFGECRPQNGELKCPIQCDGGQFTIKSKDADSILIYNDGRLTFMHCEGDEVKVKQVTEQSDDKIFLLHRLPDEQCNKPDD